jgi:hypothetical protein
MANIPRSKIVQETEEYDDLLKVSAQTRKLLKKPVAKKVPPKKSKPAAKPKPEISSLKVHLPNRKAADAFAKLLQRPLSSRHKTIRFIGRWNPKTRTVKLITKTPKSRWRFTEERSEIVREKSKRSNWNTDDFFNRTWVDMPPFENKEVFVYHTITVSFPKVADKIAFAELVKQPISDNTKSIDFPFQKPKEKRNLVWIGSKETSQPRYPIFIISKGRAQYGPLTAKVFRDLGVPFYLMVEPQEYDRYRVLCDWAEDVLVLPEGNHGKGPGRARNACWDYARDVLKSKRHWVLDDNIRAFYRLHQNERIRVGDGTIFRAAEDFVDRYKNIPIAGFGYKFFHPATETQFPFKVNTRIYSTLLIDNDCPYRWRGRYNEDTILSLDVLKDVEKNPTHEELNAVNEDGTLKNSKRERYSTVEFITFLQDKLNTQTQKGGNTAEFYQKEGTAAKSAMLVDVHPDVAEAKEMYDRDHHKVRYEVFRGNWLIRTDKRKAELKKRNWKPLKDKNPYGMRLVERISKDAAE